MKGKSQIREKDIRSVEAMGDKSIRKDMIVWVEVPVYFDRIS